jgi:hypothetical protein
MNEKDTAVKPWNIPDDDGIVNVPDELDPLVNSFGLNLRLYTISKRISEAGCVVNMVFAAEQFFKKLYQPGTGAWIPISDKSQYPPKGTDFLVLFDNGEVRMFLKENHPIAIITHYQLLPDFIKTQTTNG